MLKNIDPLLNAEVLGTLCEMGHSDIVVLSDANFPSASVARQTATGRLLRIDASAARVAEALLSVLPLDEFVAAPAMRMEVQDAPDDLPPVQQEVQEAVSKHSKFKLSGIERFRFYDMAKQAYCVITTAERRFWGCFMFQKGVIAPEE